MHIAQESITDTSETGDIVEIILYVQDLHAETTFYRDMLGLQIEEPQGVTAFGDFYEVRLKTGSCTLILQTGHTQEHTTSISKIVFYVPNVYASYYHLLENGFLSREVHSPKPGILVCEGKDPEGNQFSIQNRPDLPKPLEAQKKKKRQEITHPDNVEISVNSFRGRTITLLRNNKWFIAIEILFILAFQYVMVSLGNIGLISLLVVVMALLWLRGTNWSTLGLYSPRKWSTTIWMGIGFGILFIILNTFLIGPIISYFVHTRANLHVFDYIRGNGRFFAGEMITTWTSAAFVEEMLYRGYLFNRFADLFGRSTLGWLIALCGQAIAFGSAHAYQGLSGMLHAGVYALMVGTVYLMLRRNLWVCSIIHGMIDSLSFLLIFLL